MPMPAVWCLGRRRDAGGAELVCGGRHTTLTGGDAMPAQPRPAAMPMPAERCRRSRGQKPHDALRMTEQWHPGGAEAKNLDIRQRT